MTTRGPAAATRVPSAVLVVLALTTLAIYAPVRRFAFVNFDDPLYVSNNPMVQRGLTRAGVVWAFTTGQAAYWHPLTWLSHMLDCQVFGLDAGGHHVTNVLLHVTNALLLCVVLARLTAAPWRAAMVAGLFALHPLHVESVAWIAERKDVLSTFFWVLTVWTYLDAVERPGARRWVMVAGAFALGLMAKQMLVTLPLVLLLLDWWPLGRLTRSRESWWPLIREKIPLFALSALASGVIFVAQWTGGAVATRDVVPIGARIVNALVNYWRYLGLTLWPAGLAVFYPYQVLPMWAGVVAGAALVGVTVLVLRSMALRPYLAVGWFWYLVTLLPVIGLVQVGRQALADRFTYVPLIGPFIAVVWGVADVAAARRFPPFALRMVAGTTLLACAGLSARQVSYWRDSVTLFEHALAVTRDNDMAHNNLGEALTAAGRPDEAAVHYAEAVRLHPTNPEAQMNLGNSAYRAARMVEAEEHLREALRLRPGMASAHNSLGVVLAATGRSDEAIASYEEALRLWPEYVIARINLANTLVEQGRLVEAVDQYRKALAVNAHDEYAHYGLGYALLGLGEKEQGLAEYREALRIRPGWKPAESALAAAVPNP